MVFILFCSVILKTELFTFEFVTANVYFPSSTSSDGFLEKVSIDFVKLNSKIACGLVFVCSSNVAVFFCLQAVIRLLYMFKLKN